MVRTVIVTLIVLGVMPPAASAQNAAIERGKMIYAAEKCNVCHAVAGQGNKRGTLDEVGSKLTADEIRRWIVDAPAMTAATKATRKPVMRSYAHLAKEDVEALVAYMQSLKKN